MAVRIFVNGVLVVGLLGAFGFAALGWREASTVVLWGALLIAVGLGALFFIPIELRANLTLAGVVTVLSLWMASWVVWDPPRSGEEERYQRLQAGAAKAGVPFDSRTPLEVLDDLRERGVDAYPPRSAASLLGLASDDGAPPKEPPILPLAGRSRSTTVLCNENGEHLVVETDRYGFNNPDHAYEATSPVLMLGDSFAFGYCVRPGNDLAGRLRAEGVQLVNLGYPGTGPLIQLAQFREYGPLVRPSAIMWIYYPGNDGTNLAEEYQESSLRLYLEPDHRQGLPERQAEIDRFWAEQMDWGALRNRAETPPLTDILQLRPLRALLGGRAYPAPATRPPRGTPDQFDAVLDQMIAQAENLGAPLYFVFLPTYRRFVDHKPRGRDVLAAVRARSVPIIDFEERLLENEDPLQFYPFRQHAHFTEAGYVLLAQHILEQTPLLDQGGGDDASAFDPLSP